jgi:hypothetical protein
MKTLKSFAALQCSPWRPAAAVRPNSGQPPAGAGRARAWGGARGYWGAIWGLGRGRERAGEGGARGQAWWPPRPAVPVRWGVWEEDGTPASSVRCKGRWQKRLIGLPAGQPWSSPRLPSMAPVLTVKIRQPSHEFTFGVGMTFVSYSLVLTPVV